MSSMYTTSFHSHLHRYIMPHTRWAYRWFRPCTITDSSARAQFCLEMVLHVKTAFIAAFRGAVLCTVAIEEVRCRLPRSR